MNSTRQVGRYLVVREIGRGGMAVVYLARQPDLDRDVALKELGAFHASDPELTERFVRESQMVGSFNHPNIVTVYDYFEDNGVPYIAMEYLSRGSLRPFIGHTTAAQTIGVLEGALAGLTQAERRGIVHRDIKPENLMVTGDGTVKVADFGIAKALFDAASRRHLTATGTTVGTPAYMAPEQATAKGIGPWTDLYSVGIIAYEMTVGRVPFHDSDTPVAVLLRQVNETIPPVASIDPKVDKRFSDWIDHMLAKEPADRLRDAREAWYELEEIAVAMLGPMWRREAALDGGEGSTLDPARFDRRTTEPADADGYETFGGGAAGTAGAVEAAQPVTEPEPATATPAEPAPAEAAPAEAAAAATAYETYQPDTPAPPPTPAETTAPEAVPVPEPEGETEPPPPPVDQEAVPAADQALTPTTAPAAVSGSGTFQWPSSSRSGGGRRMGVGLAIVGLLILAAAAAVFLSSRGSSSTKPPASTSSLPTLTANPAGLVAGKLDTAAPFDGQAWLVKDGSSLLNVEDTSQTIQPTGGNLKGLAAGNGGLWVTLATSSGGKLEEVKAPGGATPVQPVSFSKTPFGVRPVIQGNTAWQPVEGGLLRISIDSEKSQPVANIGFTPYSVEAAGDAIWATDGKGKLARVPVAGGPATVTSVPGAGWLAPAPGALYLQTTKGVDRIDPANPSSAPKPLTGLPFIPQRITFAAGALWLVNYESSGTTGTATVVAIDPDRPSSGSTRMQYPVPPHNMKSKLVDISGVFWVKAFVNGQQGVEPLTIHAPS